MSSLLCYIFGKNNATISKVEKSPETNVKQENIVEDWVVVTEEQQQLPENEPLEEKNFEPMEASVASLVEFSPTLGETVMDENMKQRLQLFLQEQQLQRIPRRATLESHLIDISMNSSVMDSLRSLEQEGEKEETGEMRAVISRSGSISVLDEIREANDLINAKINPELQYPFTKNTAKKLEKQKHKNIFNNTTNNIAQVKKNSSWNGNGPSHSRSNAQFSHRVNSVKRSKGRNF